MDWKNLYQLAILEQDPARLPVRVADAQGAILDRLEATFTTAHGREYRELSEALKGLPLVHKRGDRLQEVAARDDGGIMSPTCRVDRAVQSSKQSLPER